MQIQTVTTTTIPGYRIYEYLLVLSPHKELWDKIMEVKTKFADDYESEHARWGKPHVTLANFVQYEMMQERLVNRLRIVAMGATPFKVELRDFGSFPSHTIYINIIIEFIKCQSMRIEVGFTMSVPYIKARFETTASKFFVLILTRFATYWPIAFEEYIMM